MLHMLNGYSRYAVKSRVALATMLLAVPGVAHAFWQPMYIASFNGTNGAAPFSGVIIDKAGNLYGTTYEGGASGDGTVLMLTPPAEGQTAWTETVLFSFNGTNGSSPEAGLTLGSSGNLYGTTSTGGAKNLGTVFELSPPVAGKTAWTETILASFAGNNGSLPTGTLIFDFTGNLYGTTWSGGVSSACTNGCGTVFKLAPPAAGKTAWTETVLATLKKTNGPHPTGGVVMDSTSNLFGSAYGGSTPSCDTPECGSIFELTPPSPGKKAWSTSVLFYLNGSDGRYPGGGLIRDTAGNLYGATTQGVQFNGGTVFKLAPPTSGTSNWTETILAEGFEPLDGPTGSLIFDTEGNLYGATSGPSPIQAPGTVFELSPPTGGDTEWTETTLSYFTNSSGPGGGANPAGNLVLDSKGNLYGTTASDGADNEVVCLN